GYWSLWRRLRRRARCRLGWSGRRLLVSFDQPDTVLLDQRVDVGVTGLGGRTVTERGGPRLIGGGGRCAAAEVDWAPVQPDVRNTRRTLRDQRLVGLHEPTGVRRGRGVTHRPRRVAGKRRGV